MILLDGLTELMTAMLKVKMMMLKRAIVVETWAVETVRGLVEQTALATKVKVEMTSNKPVLVWETAVVAMFDDLTRETSFEMNKKAVLNPTRGGCEDATAIWDNPTGETTSAIKKKFDLNQLSVRETTTMTWDGLIGETSLAWKTKVRLNGLLVVWERVVTLDRLATLGKKQARNWRSLMVRNMPVVSEKVCTVDHEDQQTDLSSLEATLEQMFRPPELLLGMMLARGVKIETSSTKLE